VAENRVEQAVGLYPTSGTSNDYTYSHHIVNANNQKIYGFTIEFGKEKTGFIPSFSEMQNVIKEISSALTEFSIAAATVSDIILTILMSHILFKHLRLEHSTMASPVSKAYHLTCILCHRHIFSYCRIVLTII
jgi:Zinc carboxypeptidase